MKKVKLTLSAFKRIVSALKACRRKNRMLNRQIREYNDKFAKDDK